MEREKKHAGAKLKAASEPDAMALPQPKVLNVASSITPLRSLTLRKSFSASPHASEPTSPTPLGFSISPTFRGWKKWSLSFSE